MADRLDKLPGQPDGPFFVDAQCIDCDLCRQTSPLNFMRDDEGGYSYVFKQPETPDELEMCKEAMDGCPVEAIGSDGTGAPVDTLEEAASDS